IKNCQLQNYTTDLDVLAVSNGTTIENMNISGYNITNSTVKFVYSSLGILNFLEAVTASGAHLNDGDVNATLNIASNLVSVRSDLVPGFNKSAEITIYNADSLSLSNRTPYLNGAECPANICTEIQDGDTYIFNVTHFTNYSVGGIPAPIINATLVNLTSSYQDARGKVYLDWTADTNLNVTKYNIYRSTTLINSTNLDSSKLLAANETGISYIDTSQKNTTTTYYYALTAVDKYGNENISAITNVVNETTLSTCTQTWGDWSSWNTCIAGSQKRSTSRLCYLIGVATTDEETQTCSSSSSSSGGGSISLDKVSITLAKIENGTETKVSITDDGFYLYEALVTLTKTHESVKFTFEKYDTKPTGTIGPKSDEKVFKYFQIKQLKGAEDLADATIKFKLTKKWISDNNLHPSYIRMYRFTTSWTELETTKTKEDSGNYYFEAKTPGFSYFKILALLPEEQAAQETAGNETIQEVSKTEEVDEVLADTIQETQGVTAANKTTEDEEKSVSAVKWVFPVLIVFSLLIIAIATAYAIRLRGIDDDDDEDDEEDEPKEKRHHHHKKRKKHHHTTHAKNQSEEKILRFLETGKERGHSDHSMLKKLKDTGWKKEIVGRAYDKLKNKHK
ncbi:PGF-pre-PGF domain-containing protein, partial [Candidatus Woesearchaeota archaeon]|nr:PGF-pre-PGF domain-containing protein [Candidatus Woesearchaeota archaeon]